MVSKLSKVCLHVQTIYVHFEDSVAIPRYNLDISTGAVYNANLPNDIDDNAFANLWSANQMHDIPMTFDTDLPSRRNHICIITPPKEYTYLYIYTSDKS